MTICVPKKPFEILGIIIFRAIMLSWIPIIGISLYYSIISVNWNDLYLGFVLSFCQVTWTGIWLYDVNQKNHYFKWCDNDKITEREASK